MAVQNNPLLTQYWIDLYGKTGNKQRELNNSLIQILDPVQ